MKKTPGTWQIDKNRIIIFAVFLVVSVLWMAVIFSFSSRDVKSSARQSDGVTGKLVEIIESGNNDPSEALTDKEVQSVGNYVRKTAHVIVFALLGVLTYFLSASLLLKNDRYVVPAFVSAPVCILYAISDELHQTHVEGRFGKVADVFIDTAGILIGTLLAMVIAVLVVKIVKKTVYDELEKNNEKND